MSTVKTFANYAEAIDTSLRIGSMLYPHVLRFDVAGSVRRLVTEPNDLEIVLEPKTEQFSRPQISLFAEPERYTSVSEGFAHAIKSIGTIVRGTVDGKYMQIITPEGHKVDIFMPRPSDYYRILAIRTGDSQYSKLIAQAWVAQGWVGTPDGLRLRTECVETSPKSWGCIAANPTLPPVWQSEKEFFVWLDMEYLKPQDRKG